MLLSLNLLLSARMRKFYLLALYAVVGAALQAGVLPPEWVAFLKENTVQALAIALGLGHVLPEAAK